MCNISKLRTYTYIHSLRSHNCFTVKVAEIPRWYMWKSALLVQQIVTLGIGPRSSDVEYTSQLIKIALKCCRLWIRIVAIAERLNAGRKTHLATLSIRLPAQVSINLRHIHYIQVLFLAGKGLAGWCAEDAWCGTMVPADQIFAMQPPTLF